MRKFKKSVAVLSAIAMSAAMLLNFPAGMLAVSADDTHVHDYAENNGFCTNDDCTAKYQPANQTTDKYDINGDGENDKVYEIENAGQLYWFAEYVNSSGNRHNTNAILTDNITINENVLDANGDLNGDGKNFRNWKNPIDSTGFEGCFDGNGKTISGIYMNTSDSNAGLFGIIAGFVSNLKIEDSYFENNGTSTGGICGMNSRKISNCSLSGTIISTSTDPESVAGGICGDIASAMISGCSFSGKVISENGSAGGISGGYKTFSGSTITECSNFGSISGKKRSGGICGYGLSFTIRSCYNAGNVTGVNNVGGICGEISESTIDSCYNTGNVMGEMEGNVTIYTGNTGGICGYNKSSGRSSYISNCYNIGKVANGENVGEICGYNHCVGGWDAVVENCFYPKESENHVLGVGKTERDTDSERATATSDTEAKSTAQFRSGEVAYLLAQGNSIWGQELGKDNYPVLGGKTVVKDVNGAYANGTIQITGYNLSLADNINLNVHVCIGGGHNKDEVTATFNGNSISAKSNDKNVYTFEYAVPAKDLDKEFKFEITVDNETETLTTSVNKYLDIISKDAKYTGIANALKTYGKAAKAYFENGAPIAVNGVSASDLKDYQMTLNEENMPDGVEYVGSTLLLNSTTTIRHYFKFDSSIDPDNVKFYADNFDYESLKLNPFGNSSDNIYYVDFIDKCGIKNLGKTHSLQINNNTVIENCGILSYVKSTVSSSDKNLSNLAKALYLYNKAAVEYSNSNSNS